jgi:membrane protein DedA with SNARE-associated domain
VPFLGLTVAGASLWGGGLIVLGHQLGENWDEIRKWKALDLAIAGVVVLVLVVLAVRFIRTRRAAAHTGGKAGS